MSLYITEEAYAYRKQDKGAVFTNANFDETDKQYFYNLIGIESTNLLLRHH